MLTTGLSLAVLSSTGFYLIYTKLPQCVRAWMVRHPLITDIVACCLTYMLFGGTLVALFAAAFVGIIVSILLALLNNEITADALARLADRVKTLQDKFVDMVASSFPQKDESNVQ